MLLALKSRDWASVVPIKFVAGLVPAFPPKFHAGVIAGSGCHEARPFASDVRTDPKAGFPLVI